MIERGMSEMLQQVSEINVVAKDYLIVDALGLLRREVQITKIIYSLLNSVDNPRYYLLCFELFLQHVLDLEVSDFKVDDIKKIYVAREKAYGRERMDLVVYSQSFHVPIEVKIDAKDQKNQCSRYLDYARQRNNEESNIYYLTLNGHSPSKVAFKKNKILEDQRFVKNISFAKEINSWLTQIRSFVEKNSQFSHAICQIQSSILAILQEKGFEYEMEKVCMENGYFKKEAIELYNFMSEQQKVYEEKVFNKLVETVRERFRKNENIFNIDNIPEEEIVKQKKRPVFEPIFEIRDDIQKLSIRINLEYDTNLYISLRLYRYEDYEESKASLNNSAKLNEVVSKFNDIGEFKNNSSVDIKNLITWSHIKGHEKEMFKIKGAFFEEDYYQKMETQTIEEFNSIKDLLRSLSD